MIAKEFRTQSAVVWQRDILLSTATVREAIMTSALLKLPQAMPVAEKRRRADEIVSELSLTHRAGMMIGEDIDGTVSSISGGERRRVSIGIALVTDPRAVFLDEPTTGLDSDSALSIVSLLKRLASRGRTVLCTIHQPSADICERFDDFMLLSSGNMVYCGAWRAAESWFDGLGHPRPSHRNLAEHFMVLCKDPEVVAASSAAHRDTFSLDAALGDAESGGPGYERTLSRWSLRHTVTAQALGSSAAPDAEHVAAATSSFYQVRILSVRFVRHMWRAPLNVIIQLVQYLFFGTLVGLTYWKVPDDMNGGTFDRIASLWFICACLVLQPAQNAVAVFARERALLRREFGNRLYNYFAFFTAKSLTQLPLQLVFVMCFSVLVYFMIGFQAVASKFFVFYGTLVLVALTADTVGQLCAAVHREVVVGQIINGMLCLLLLMFTGFIQTETPAYFVWLKKSSFVAFAYSAVVANEFTGLKLQGPLLPVDGMDAVPANVNNGLSVGVDFAYLAAIMLAIRVFSYGWIATSLRKHWF
jgi:ABC-type lipoprotein export system ATPase subunit